MASRHRVRSIASGPAVALLALGSCANHEGGGSTHETIDNVRSSTSSTQPPETSTSVVTPTSITGATPGHGTDVAPPKDSGDASGSSGDPRSSDDASSGTP